MPKQKTALAEAPGLRFLDPKTFKEIYPDGGGPSEERKDGIRKHLVAGIEKDPQGEDRVLQFAISTGTVDRDGDTIDPHGWDLSHYNKNGVVLWAHDYHEPPIGKALATWVEDGKLKSRAQFASRDLYPFADMIYRMYLEGFLSAVSVGFSPTKWARNEERGGYYPVDYLEQELLEYSAVPIPANPEALLEAKAKGIDVQPMVEWASKVLDTAGGEKGLWLPRKDVETLYTALKDGTATVSLPSEPKAPGSDADGDDESEADEKTVIATVRLYDDGTVDVHDLRGFSEAVESLSEEHKQALAVLKGANKDEREPGLDVERMAAEFEQVLERIERLLDQRLSINVETTADADDGNDKTNTNNANDGDDEYIFRLIDNEGTDDKAEDEVHIDPKELVSVVRDIVQDEFRRATGRLD